MTIVEDKSTLTRIIKISIVCVIFITLYLLLSSMGFFEVTTNESIPVKTIAKNNEYKIIEEKVNDNTTCYVLRRNNVNGDMGISCVVNR